ncbi:MAG: toll/interleukin-1 receptor domain-containing protein [Candidatus Bathyarchaeota archaeon]|nr:toll/interleukin-1 receptor domain-containing protein [Candidatus Bathyarchaeum sp.]
MTSTNLTEEEKKKHISVDEYELGKILVFVSYSNDDKILAGRIKLILEGYGLSVFLAHDDIPPLCDWQMEISKNLKKCDVFLPILTHSFCESEWCDQETGMAFALDKLIVPLKVDIAPYGFINKIQACKLDVDRPKRTCHKIIEVLKANQFSDRLFDCLLRDLESAPTFDYANKTLEQISEYEKINKKQINQIIRIAIRNNQFRLSRKGIPFLASITKNHSSKINPFLLKAYNKVKDDF